MSSTTYHHKYANYIECLAYLNLRGVLPPTPFCKPLIPAILVPISSAKYILRAGGITSPYEGVLPFPPFCTPLILSPVPSIYSGADYFLPHRGGIPPSPSDLSKFIIIYLTNSELTAGPIYQNL